MVENKRQELEKKIAMGKERRRRKKRVRKLRQSKGDLIRDPKEPLLSILFPTYHLIQSIFIIIALVMSPISVLILDGM